MALREMIVVLLLSLFCVSCELDSWNEYRGNNVEAVRVFQLEEQHSAIMSIDVSPDDKQIAYAGDTVSILDIPRGTRRILRSPTKGVVQQSVKFSPDGSYLAYGGRTGVIAIQDIRRGRSETSLEPDVGLIRSLDWSSDGKMIVASGDSGMVVVLDVSSEAIVQRFEGYNGYPSFRALFSPDDRLVYAGQGDGTIRAWDVGSGKEVWTVDAEGSVWEIALCENGKSLLSSHMSGAVILWDLETKRERNRMELSKPTWYLRSGSVMGQIAVTLGGKQALFPSSVGNIELWDLENWSMLECFKAHPGETMIWEICLSHDGSWFATAGGDGTIRLWRFK